MKKYNNSSNKHPFHPPYKPFGHSLMIQCKEACALYSESQDRKLDWKERMALYIHLTYCPHCRKYSRQLRKIREMMQQWQEPG
ncbi:zf-HC2 domain-containing protein [Neisseria iguanae]|nr:zf-HC2 domain-containing protein [Neisseria iguanae]